MKKAFDGDAFYRALERTVATRAVTWKHVAAETGVSASTLARMAQGRKPDSPSLAALAAWAGIDPRDFVSGAHRNAKPESMAQISSLLRRDPSLDSESAAAVEAIVRAAYEQLKKPSEPSS